MRRVIGIDFGTSTTYMNVKRYDGDRPDGDKYSYIPVVFNYGESSGYVATIVRENSDGSLDFGAKAAEPLEGARIHTEIKMRLESPDESLRMEAQRITKAFFRFLHDTYVQQAGNFGGGEDEEETVVSYPVKWQKETAQFMLESAREAGFRNVHGMDEAAAAVAAVVCQNSGSRKVIYEDKPGYLLLIDMGAGTTDLVVCRYRTGDQGLSTEMVANWPRDAGEPTFGGRELDKALECYVEEYLKRALNPALASQAHVIAAAPGQAKMWKERNVSITLAAGKDVSTCAYIGTYRSMGMLDGPFPAFGRVRFEEYIKPSLTDYVQLVKGCLDETARRDEAFAAAGLDLVILTGGHSAWYFAREIVTGAMEGWLDHPALALVRENPCRVVSLPNPQSTVALGLVYSRLAMDLAQQEPESSDTPAKDSQAEKPQVGREGQRLPCQEAETSDPEQKAPAQPAKQTIPCPACQGENKAEDCFCVHCGASLKEENPRKDSVSAKNAHDDAFYRQKAQEFLAGIAYELSDSKKKYTRKVLKLPDKDTILYCDTVSGDGDFAECALTNTGLYFKTGIVGKTRRLSWTEFAHLRWTDSALGYFKTDAASVISSRFSGRTLGDIYAYLHGLSEGMPDDTPRPPAPEKLDLPHDAEIQQISEQPYIPRDRTKCANCGTKIPPNAKKCPVCGRKTRKLPQLPFKIGFMSLYSGEVKMGVAKATGTLTIYDDRLEFRRFMGNTAAL